MAIVASRPIASSPVYRALRRIAHLSVFGTALTGIALASNVVQIVTLAMYPFSRRAVGRINAFICQCIWRTIDFAFERANKARITFSGSGLASIPTNTQSVLLSTSAEKPATESAIVISNHVFAMDWALLNAIAMRRGMLAHCKYFIKKSMQWVPFFGVGMRLAGFPFLSRNWASDSHKIERVFHNLKSDKLPCWLISFLEGTRITPKKLAESQAFCQSRDLPVFANVLYPRKKGFVATLSALRDSHVRHVYDFTLGYLDVATGEVNVRAPNLAAMHADDLSGEYAFHIHVERIAISDIPEDDAGIEQWVEDRWRIKDALIASWKVQWPRAGVDAGVVLEPFYST
ncbi:acyltransferase-domain-containing protein [Blastocladiella britannica]|nr:acyltransferase-domain-containing protein [Blastocladiella britannica]